MILSVLIPTLECRKPYLDRLLGILNRQRMKELEVVTLKDKGDESIGQKRNKLLDVAQGDYLVFVDDDDTVAENYVAALLNALADKPDCVGFKIRRTIDGKHWGEQRNSLAYRTEVIERYEDKTNYWGKRIGHLNPVRSDYARAIRFQPWNACEDSDYAERLQPLLKSEVFVDQYLYTYEYRQDKDKVEVRQVDDYDQASHLSIEIADTFVRIDDAKNVTATVIDDKATADMLRRARKAGVPVEDFATPPSAAPQAQQPEDQASS